MPEFVADGRAIAQLLDSEDGPAMRFAATIAVRVRDRSKELVGVSDERETGDPRHLRDAINMRVGVDEKGPMWLVGSDLPHTLVHHEGSAPHEIRARNARALAFRWGKTRNTGRFRVLGAAYAYFKKVQHPGTAPNPFLTQALAESAG